MTTLNEIPTVSSPFDFMKDFGRWIRFKTLVYGFGVDPKLAEAYTTGAIGVVLMAAQDGGSSYYYQESSDSPHSSIGHGRNLKPGDLVFRNPGGYLEKIPPAPDQRNIDPYHYYAVCPPANIDIDIEPDDYKPINGKGLKKLSGGGYRECYANESPDAIELDIKCSPGLLPIEEFKSELIGRSSFEWRIWRADDAPGWYCGCSKPSDEGFYFRYLLTEWELDGTHSKGLISQLAAEIDDLAFGAFM